MAHFQNFKINYFVLKILCPIYSYNLESNLENNNFSYILTLQVEIINLILFFLITHDILRLISSNLSFWNKNKNNFFIQEKKEFLGFANKLKMHFSSKNLDIMHKTGLIAHMNKIRNDLDSENIRAIWNHF